MTEPKNEMSAEEQAAARKKAKAKIRTIRIWAWVILALLAATALLSRMRHVQTAGKAEHL